MSTNKVTTLGYILKRLRDSGYYTYKLYNDYAEHDPRAWTIIIDPAGASVLCTCYVNDPFFGDSYLEIYDGGQFIPGRLKIATSSFEVLVEHLNRFGITGHTNIKKYGKVKI